MPRDQTCWERLENLLYEKNILTCFLQIVEDKFHVRRIYTFFGIVAVLAFYLMVGYGAQFVCNFIGFIYPAYASVKAIESREKDDDTKWLTYWVVYSAFMLVETVTDIFFFWIPFYSLLKCIFLVYCFAPFPNNGSIFLYHKFIKPCVLGCQDQVDGTLANVAHAAGNILKGVEEMTVDAAGELVKRRLQEAPKTD